MPKLRYLLEFEYFSWNRLKWNGGWASTLPSMIKLIDGMKKQIFERETKNHPLALIMLERIQLIKSP